MKLQPAKHPHKSTKKLLETATMQFTSALALLVLAFTATAAPVVNTEAIVNTEPGPYLKGAFEKSP